MNTPERDYEQQELNSGLSGYNQALSPLEKELVTTLKKEATTYVNAHPDMSFKQVCEGVMSHMIRTGKAPLIQTLKTNLGLHQKDIAYRDIASLKLTLHDVIEVLKSPGVVNNIDARHDAILAKSFADTILITTGAGWSKEQQDLYTATVIQNKQYIVSIDTLARALELFFHTASKQSLGLSEKDVAGLYNTSLPFSSVGKQAVDEGLFSLETLRDSHKTGHITTGSAEEDLLNTYLTIYGSTAIRTQLQEEQQAYTRLESMYSMPGGDLLLTHLSVDKLSLADLYPDYKIILESNTATNAEKYFATIKTASIHVRKIGHTFADTLDELVRVGGDFSTLTVEHQTRYLQEYKKAWLQTASGKDLINHCKDQYGLSDEIVTQYVDALFSYNSQQIPIRDVDGQEHIVTIEKKLLATDNKDTNAYVLEQYGLPIAYTMRGDVFDEKDMHRLHTKKDGTYATSIPQMLTMLAYATKNVQTSDDQAKENLDTANQHLHSHILQSQFSGPTSDIGALEEIDRQDGGEVEKLSTDFVATAKNTYATAIAKQENDIANLDAKKGYIDQDINRYYEELQKNKRMPDHQKKDIEDRIKEKKQEGIEIATQRSLVNKTKDDYRQKKEIIGKILKARKKKELEESHNLAEKTPEVKQNVQSIEELEKKHEKTPLQEMEAAWGALQGDSSAPLAVGSMLCIELGDARGPLTGWKKPWVTGIVTRVDQDGSFVLQWRGLDAPLGGKNTAGENLEGSSSTIVNAEGLEDLKDKLSGGKVWKFAKYDSWQTFGLHIKENKLNIDKEYKDFLIAFLDKVDFGSMYRKDVSGNIVKNDGNKIKYLGGSIDDVGKDKDGKESVQTQKLWYEVEQLKDGVKITGKDRDGNPYTQTLSPQEFVTFLVDKGLYTYTQDEVDQINKDRTETGLPTLQDAIDASYDIPAQKKRIWTNLKSIGHCWKLSLDGVKKWLKDKQGKSDKELENAMLTSSRFKKLGNIPFIGKAFEDMYEGKDKELDTAKTKEIKEAMEEPEKNGEDNKEGPYNYILEAGKFKSVAEGGILTGEKDLRKFAGYYCYVLSKRSQYPMGLAKYAGKGVWVRGLLGEEYQKQYLAYIASKQDAVEKNPNDAESKKQLSQGELGFLKKVYGDGSPAFKQRLEGVFGKQFFGKTLGGYDGELFSMQGVEDAYKTAKGKLFNEAKGDFGKSIKERRFVDMYGVLKGMGENIKKDPSNYSEWMMRFAFPILSGITVRHMDDTMRGDYEKLAREYLSPFGLYAKETDGQRKLLQLFSIAADDAGLQFSDTFAKYMPTTSEHRPAEDQLMSFYDELAMWWFDGGKGNAIIERLLDPGKILKIKQQLQNQFDQATDLSKKQELLNKINALGSYVDKKALDDSNDYIDTKLGGVVAEKNIMNFSPGTVQQLFKYKNGSFDKELVESAPKAWKSLTKKIKEYDTSSTEKASPELYAFVLKKFIMFFESKGHFANANLPKLLVALKYSHNPDAMWAFMTDVIDPQDQAPKEVHDAIAAFQAFFKNNKPIDEDMKSILDSVVEKGTGDKYQTVEPTGIQDSNRKEKNNKKARITANIMKEKGKNYYHDNGENISIYSDGKGGYVDENYNVLVPQSKQGKNNQQDKNKITFKLYDKQGNYIKDVVCFDFDESALSAMNQDGGNPLYNYND